MSGDALPRRRNYHASSCVLCEVLGASLLVGLILFALVLAAIVIVPVVWAITELVRL